MAGLKLMVILSIAAYASAFLEGDRSTKQSYASASITTKDYQYVTVSGNYGTFSSPNYPGSYPTNTVKVYQIGHIPYVPVRLTFNVFNLEGCTDCSCDSLTIREYGSNSKRVLCGGSLPNQNGFLDLTGPVEVIFKSDGSVSASGFLASYEVGYTSTPHYWHGSTYTSPLPTVASGSPCPAAVCPTCRPGYVNQIYTRYQYGCPVCECVREGDQTTAFSCPNLPEECPTCQPDERPQIIYGRPCTTCVCQRYVTTGPRPSTWPPSFTTGPRPSTWPPSFTTGPRPSTWPPSSTGGPRASTWLPHPGTWPVVASTWPPISTRDPRVPSSSRGPRASTWLPHPGTWPVVASTSPPMASTWPPVSPSSRGFLSSLFRIHGELSDLEDRAKQIDDEVIDLIQQIEGNNFSGNKRSALLDAIAEKSEKTTD